MKTTLITIYRLVPLAVLISYLVIFLIRKMKDPNSIFYCPNNKPLSRFIKTQENQSYLVIGISCVLITIFCMV